VKYSEFLSDQPQLSHFQSARATLRDIAISTLSYVPRPQPKNWIRPIYGHGIFKDQVANFERNIKNCLNIGEFISTDELHGILAHNLPIDGKLFHLSFDDGFRNVLKEGKDVLEKYSIPAIIFVNPKSVNTNLEESSKFCEESLLNPFAIEFCTWEDLRAAKAANIDIGSHTFSHKRLSTISSDPDLMKFEILESKNKLEQELSIPINHFSWPHGTKKDIDNVSLECIKNAGYLTCFSAVRGSITEGKNTDPFYIPRHQIETQYPDRHTRYFLNGGAEKI